MCWGTETPTPSGNDNRTGLGAQYIVSHDRILVGEGDGTRAIVADGVVADGWTGTANIHAPRSVIANDGILDGHRRVGVGSAGDVDARLTAALDGGMIDATRTANVQHPITQVVDIATVAHRHNVKVQRAKRRIRTRARGNVDTTPIA